jgi:hypothetical protein
VAVAVIASLVVLGPAEPASACSTYVSGYTRSNGTYVSGHYRSCPDSTVTNNYTFSGNTNPYTGTTGTNRYYSSPSSPYYNPSYGSGYGSSYGSSYWP